MELKANELRIGNWINGNGVDFQVYTETFADIESTYGIFKPIPLTEDWLIRFGFEKSNLLHDNDYAWTIKSPSYFRLEYSLSDLFYESVNYTELPYVHSLQNLYFALTGEELTDKTN